MVQEAFLRTKVSFVLTTTAGGGLQQDGPTDNRGSMLNGRGVGRRHRKTIDGFFTFSFELFSLSLVTFVQFVREALLEKTRVCSILCLNCSSCKILCDDFAPCKRIDIL